MVPDGRNGRTDAAKTISLRLRQGIINHSSVNIAVKNTQFLKGEENSGFS